MRHLRDRLFVAFGLTVAVIVGVLALTVRGTTLGVLKQALLGKVVALSQPFEQTQQAQFRVLGGLAEQVSSDPVLQELRIRSERYPMEIRSLRDQGRDYAKQSNLDLFVMTDLEGNVLVDVRDMKSVPPDGRNLADDPLVSRTLAGGRAFNTYLIYEDGRLYAASIGPITRGDYVDGAMILGRRVDERLTRLWASISADSVLVGAGEKVLAATDPESHDERTGQALIAAFQRFLREWTPPPVLPPSKKNPRTKTSTVEVTLNGRAFLALAHPLWQRGEKQPVAWLFFLAPLDELYAAANDQSTRILAFGLAALLTALFVSNIVAIRISKPIEGLADKMRRVGEGDLQQQARVVGKDEVARLASSFNDMVSGLRQNQVLKKYIPLGAREAIERETVELGGRRIRATILFSDLRGFTSLSENIDPSDVVTLLNDLLASMTQIIHDAGGDVIDYIGDAILAMFGDEEGSPGAVRAVRAALAMQAALQQAEESSGNPHLAGIRMGIGLHTGVLVSGNIGTEDRLKHTVIGDTVNQASRIQDRSRDGRHTCILVSTETRAEIEEVVPLTFFGNEHLKGISAPVEIWEVLEPAPTPEGSASAIPPR